MVLILSPSMSEILLIHKVCKFSSGFESLNMTLNNVWANWNGAEIQPLKDYFPFSRQQNYPYLPL